MSKKIALSLLLVMLGLASWESLVDHPRDTEDVHATADGTPFPN